MGRKRTLVIETEVMSESKESTTVQQRLKTVNYVGEAKNSAVDDLVSAIASMLLEFGMSEDKYRKIVTEEIPEALMEEFHHAKKIDEGDTGS